MKFFLTPLILLAICYALFFTVIHCTYGQLPLRVASHFDIEGRPNGWMSRDGIVNFMLGLGIFLPAFIVGLMASAGRIPVSFINLPNRDYWFAPERRPATCRVLLRYGLWFASLNVLFLAGLHVLIVQANQAGGHLNGTGMGLLSGGFLLGTLVWALLLRRQFRLQP